MAFGTEQSKTQQILVLAFGGFELVRVKSKCSNVSISDLKYYRPTSSNTRKDVIALIFVSFSRRGDGVVVSANLPCRCPAAPRIPPEWA